MHAGIHTVHSRQSRGLGCPQQPSPSHRGQRNNHTHQGCAQGLTKGERSLVRNTPHGGRHNACNAAPNPTICGLARPERRRAAAARTASASALSHRTTHAARSKSGASLRARATRRRAPVVASRSRRPSSRTASATYSLRERAMAHGSPAAVTMPAAARETMLRDGHTTTGRP